MRAARAATRAARAGLYPTVTGDAAALRSARSQPSAGASLTNSYNAVLDVGWELDLWGRVRRGVESSVATGQASTAELAAATLSAQALLAQDYLLLRVQDAQIDSAARVRHASTSARCSSRATSTRRESSAAATWRRPRRN